MANEPDTETALQTTATDYVASAAKAVLGMVPFAGSLLAELAGSVIPNQRIDRLAKFALELEAKLSGFDQAHVRAQLNDENFTDLLEEGVRQASRSVSDERRQYLAAILANGISFEAATYAESRHLLRILGEINDIEVVWLRFYAEPPTPVSKPSEYRKRHKAILESVTAFMGSGQETLDKKALQDSYKEHLAGLGLLKPRYKIDHKTKQPVFDNHTGSPEVQGYSITPLGRLLLRQIDLSPAPRT